MFRRKLKSWSACVGDRIARHPRITDAAHWVLGASKQVARDDEYEALGPGEDDEYDLMAEASPQKCYLYPEDCPLDGRLLTRADLVLMALLAQRMDVSPERLTQAFGLQPDDAAVLFAHTGASLETVLEVYLLAYPLAASTTVEATKSLQLLDSLLALAYRLLPTGLSVPVPCLLDALFEVHDAQPLASERAAGSSQVAEAKQSYRWMNSQPLGDLQEALQGAQMVNWGRHEQR